MITHTIKSCWIPSENKVEWPGRYRSGSKVITCDTPSHASDHLYQIWKESIQNCRRCRADTIFKVKAKWPWKYRSRSKVITCSAPLMLMMICAKYGKKNVTEQTRFSKSRLNDLEDISQGQRSSHATHLPMLAIICTKYGKNPLGTVDATERTRFSRPNKVKGHYMEHTLSY